MPTLKARVFCDPPQHAASLVEALRVQGYQVEVIHPEARPASPSDLDIVLETCTRADVLRRAAELAADQGADIVVAPGAVSVTSTEAEAGALPAQPISAEPSAPVETHSSAAELEQPALRMMESAAHEPETTEDSNAVPRFWRRAIPAAAVTLSAWTIALREALTLARDQAREYREHALTRLADVRAKREQRLLELTHQRIEAQEHASKFAAARTNAAEYLRQLQRQSGGRIQSLRPDSLEQNAPTGAAPGPWLSLFAKVRERARLVRWDTALAGLASAGALFAIGLAVASFNSKPALLANEGHAPTATSNPAPAPASAPQSSAATKPVAHPSPNGHTRAAKPSPAQRGQARRDHALASRDQAIGNDVVIRRLASPTPTPKVQAQGWKHFSDLDH